MNRRNRRQVDKLVDLVEQMREVVDSLTRPVLEDLVRRAEQAPTPDGYPTSARGTIGDSGDADPVLRVVMQREHPRRDVVGETIAEIVASLHEARNLLRVVDKRRKAVVHAGSLVKDLASSVTYSCECCGRRVSNVDDDRLKSGYGPCCWMAWTRWRRAEVDAGRESSRTRFEAWHKVRHVQPEQAVAVGDEHARFFEPTDLEDLRRLKVLPPVPGA